MVSNNQRELLQAWTLDELKSRKIPFVRLHGSLENRIAGASLYLSIFKKWRAV